MSHSKEYFDALVYAQKQRNIIVDKANEEIVNGFRDKDAPTPVVYNSMSIDEICQYIDCYVTNGEMVSRLIGLIRKGHECRNVLVSLSPYSRSHRELVNDYDYFWLGEVDLK